MFSPFFIVSSAGFIKRQADFSENIRIFRRYLHGLSKPGRFRIEKIYNFFFFFILTDADRQTKQKVKNKI